MVLGKSQDDYLIAYTGLKDGSTRIYLAQVSGSGVVSTQVLPNGNESADLQTRPVLQLDTEGNLHCVWLGRDPGRAEIYYSRFPKRDSKWTSPVTFAAGKWKTTPHMTTDPDGNLYVYFSVSSGTQKTGRIAFYVSRDGGHHWIEGDPNFSIDKRHGMPSEALLVPGLEGQLFLVWTDPSPGGRSIVFNRSSDSGLHWLEEPLTINEDSKWSLTGPKILQAGGRLLLLWSRRFLTNSGSVTELWSDMSIDSGVTWEGNHKVLLTKSDRVETALYWSGKEVIFLWTDVSSDRSARLMGKPLWSPKAISNNGEMTIMETSRPGALENLSLNTSGSRMTVALTESCTGQPKRVVVAIQQPDKWHLESFRQTSDDSDQMSPLVLYDSRNERYVIVFHEVRRRIHLMEDPVFATRLLLVRIKDQAGLKVQ
jgi:hypothetical protein